MTARGYKKYMKQNAQKEHPLIKIFIISFFGMLLLCTFVINSIAKKMSVDTSIGDYKEQSMDDFENKNIVDNRLAIIQNEDQERTFTDLMQNPEDVKRDNSDDNAAEAPNSQNNKTENSVIKNTAASQDTVYKVFIGSYTSAEQAKVAKEIIQESGSGLNPIVKCIDSNNYTLQVGIFKNKQSADTMLATILKNNLPGRIVQEN